jgi:hypothetical protein
MWFKTALDLAWRRKARGLVGCQQKGSARGESGNLTMPSLVFVFDSPPSPVVAL